MQQSWDPLNVADVLVEAFPSRLAGDVQSVLAAMPVAKLGSVEPFQVEVQGETVAIPSRIYNEEPDADLARSLTGTQQVMVRPAGAMRTSSGGRAEQPEDSPAGRQSVVEPRPPEPAYEYQCQWWSGRWYALVPDGGLKGPSVWLAQHAQLRDWTISN
ncbi:hypothetical protein OHT93_36820 [Streptomyces sp. NBC_00191]|uniref:hypothetical protein n=1 Tax=Streptomyces sp. NBC_00191 TaxID=2975674 RepID=UPI00324F125F